VARPTRAAVLNRAAEEADDAIKAQLPALTQVLIDAALAANEELTCPHCRKKFKSTKVGDPRIALSLLERVAGKATEKRDTGSTGALEKLIIELSTAATAPGTAKSAAELAAEAKRKAEVRAALAAAKASP
jgi:hypothetical protein